MGWRCLGHDGVEKVLYRFFSWRKCTLEWHKWIRQQKRWWAIRAVEKEIQLTVIFIQICESQAWSYSEEVWESRDSAAKVQGFCLLFSIALSLCVKLQPCPTLPLNSTTEMHFHLLVLLYCVTSTLCRDANKYKKCREIANQNLRVLLWAQTLSFHSPLCFSAYLLPCHIQIMPHLAELLRSP